MKEFTDEELANYNGKNGKPVYIAYEEKVYDLTSSFLWKDGSHQVFHLAGVDLTKALEEAPHGSGALKKFPVIGVLVSSGISGAQENAER